MRYLKQLSTQNLCFAWSEECMGMGKYVEINFQNFFV